MRRAGIVGEGVRIRDCEPGLRELAEERRRFGYRRLQVLLERKDGS